MGLLFKFKFLVKYSASLSTINCLLAASEGSVGLAIPLGTNVLPASTDAFPLGKA